VVALPLHHLRCALPSTSPQLPALLSRVGGAPHLQQPQRGFERLRRARARLRQPPRRPQRRLQYNSKRISIRLLTIHQGCSIGSLKLQ
jgi:hypothetical protein